MNQVFATLTVYIGVVGALTVLGAVLQFLSQGALTASVADSYMDRPVSFSSGYREMGKRIGALLGYMGLLVLIVVGSVVVLFAPFLFIALAGASSSSAGPASAFGCLTTCLIFPLSIFALYAYMRLQLVVPAIMVEGLGPVQAMRRSWRLIQNYWWRTLADNSAARVLAYIIAVGPAVVVSGLAGYAASSNFVLQQAISSTVTVLAGMFFVPLQLISDDPLLLRPARAQGGFRPRRGDAPGIPVRLRRLCFRHTYRICCRARLRGLSTARPVSTATGPTTGHPGVPARPGLRPAETTGTTGTTGSLSVWLSAQSRPTGGAISAVIRRAANPRRASISPNTAMAQHHKIRSI